MEPGIDFVFRDDLFDPKKDGTTVPIELKLDPFAGICYRYTTVRFKMEEDNVPRLQYDYEIIKTNDLSMVTLRKNEKFNTVKFMWLGFFIWPINVPWDSVSLGCSPYLRARSFAQYRTAPLEPRPAAFGFPDIPLPVLAASCEGYKASGIWNADPLQQRAGLEWLRDAMLACGAIRRTATYEDLSDMRFARQVMSEDLPPLKI